MTKLKRVLAVILSAATAASLAALTVSAEKGTDVYGQDADELVAELDVIEKGTLKVRKGGIIRIPDSIDGMFFEVEDESVCSVEFYAVSDYKIVGNECGTTRIVFRPFSGNELHAWNVEVSGEYSKELFLDKTACTLDLIQNPESTVYITDPFDDSWYNFYNGTSIYNDNARWTSDNKEVVTVVNGKLCAMKEGTAKITAELDGKVMECAVTVTKTYAKGDCNMDGQVNILDARAVLGHVLKSETLDDEQLALADCNSDNRIDMLDAIGIARTLLYR